MPNPPQGPKQQGGSSAGGPPPDPLVQDPWASAAARSSGPPGPRGGGHQSSHGRPAGSGPSSSAAGTAPPAPVQHGSQASSHPIPVSLRDALDEMRAAQESLQSQAHHIDKAEQHIGLVRTNLAQVSGLLSEATEYLAAFAQEFGDGVWRLDIGPASVQAGSLSDAASAQQPFDPGAAPAPSTRQPPTLRLDLHA